MLFVQESWSSCSLELVLLHVSFVPVRVATLDVDVTVVVVQQQQHHVHNSRPVKLVK